ncbi:MAG: sensor histidine kinase [Luteolibacter sp.]
MKTSGRNIWSWSLFGVTLLAALCGWLWVIQRLVKNEAEVADARVRVAEERFLNEIAGEFQQEILNREPKSPDWTLLPEIARKGETSGIWFDTDQPQETSLPKDKIQKWREALRQDSMSEEDLVAAFRSGELEWGWVESGRDAAVGILLSIIRKNGHSDPLLDLLNERVWNYEGPDLSPGFRLLMIRALQQHRNDPNLERLATAESIRLVSGRTEELGQKVEYELIDFVSGTKQISTFWTKWQLEELIPEAKQQGIVLSGEEIPGRTSIRLPGFSKWPFLSLQETGSRLQNSVITSDNALLWVGGFTGFAVLALSIGAALAAAEASRIARMRTDLAASVAHELRTPLAGQRLLLESLLERDDQTPKEKDEYIAMAFRENKRLSRLAEEFLTFSRLDRGVLTLENESVDIPEAVSNAVESLREKWNDRDCQLDIQVSPELPRVSGDSQAVATILRNLLENAWKYSRPPRKIRVEAREADDGVWIKVSDNGIGLPSKEKKRIFRQFYQIDRRLARSREGMGLGLSIVKLLVGAMEGRINLESTDNQGSEFSIWLKKST